MTSDTAACLLISLQTNCKIMHTEVGPKTTIIITNWIPVTSDQDRWSLTLYACLTADANSTLNVINKSQISWLQIQTVTTRHTWVCGFAPERTTGF